MSSQAYVGTAQRTFRQAFVHLLETSYGLIGSRRVLELLAEDTEKLIDNFYPIPERLSSGWMLFAGTRATGGKAYPGKQVSDEELLTISWPVLMPEDLEYLATHPETVDTRREWQKQRLVRLIEYGSQHPDGPVLLTQADLAAMLGLSTVQVSKLLECARQETGKTLITKGYYFDQGMRPSHKAEIIDLYEQGTDEAEIAYRTQHSAESVGHYIRDYERVREILSKGIPIEQISSLIGMTPGVVAAHAKLVAKYYPEHVPLSEEHAQPPKD